MLSANRCGVAAIMSPVCFHRTPRGQCPSDLVTQKYSNLRHHTREDTRARAAPLSRHPHTHSRTLARGRRESAQAQSDEAADMDTAVSASVNASGHLRSLRGAVTRVRARGGFLFGTHDALQPRRGCAISATSNVNSGRSGNVTRKAVSVAISKTTTTASTARQLMFRGIHTSSSSSSSSVVACRANKTSRDDELLKAPDDAPGEKGSAARKHNKDDEGANADGGEAERGGLAALRLLDLDTVRQRWDVPWGGWRVFLGIGGWSFSFVFTAAVLFPVLCIVNGYDPRDFNPSEKSEYILLIQAAETLETFFVLWLLLRKFRPELDQDWFNADPRSDAFSMEKGWLTWGLIGYVMVFVSIAATGTVLNAGEHVWEAIQLAQHVGASAGGGDLGGGLVGGLQAGTDAGDAAAAVGGGSAAVFGGDSPAASSGAAGGAGTSASSSGAGTIDAVLPLLGGGADQTTRFLSILTVTSVLAPALEEVVFRGFLLASLTKWLPTPGAVVFSSVLFAGAHFAPRDFPQLVTLGMVLGFSYSRTRNLLTPMVIHSLWNSVRKERTPGGTRKTETDSTAPSKAPRTRRTNSPITPTRHAPHFIEASIRCIVVAHGVYVHFLS